MLYREVNFAQVGEIEQRIIFIMVSVNLAGKISPKE